MASFPPLIISAAQASQRKWGVPAAVTLSQWALESGWGKHEPGGLASNNPFGITADKLDAPNVESHTWEYLNGHWVFITRHFRKYASIAEAFDDHGRILATLPIYANLKALEKNPAAYARGLAHHYASSPSYGETLVSIINSHDLYQYDVA